MLLIQFYEGKYFSFDTTDPSSAAGPLLVVFSEALSFSCVSYFVLLCIFKALLKELINTIEHLTQSGGQESRK